MGSFDIRKSCEITTKQKKMNKLLEISTENYETDKNEQKTKNRNF